MGATYSGGTGEPNDPYQIANVADFEQLAVDPNNWNKTFILTANIDLTGLIFTEAPIAPDINATSGFEGTQFTGIFDGKNHIIFNLTINQPTKYYLGLFGYIGSDGQVRNLRIESANIIGIDRIGGLVGYGDGGSITSCFWDIQTSGIMASSGGTGKTTAEMKTLSTFTSAGWDFTNETVNGANDFWRMCTDGIIPILV